MRSRFNSAVTMVNFDIIELVYLEIRGLSKVGLSVHLDFKSRILLIHASFG